MMGLKNAEETHSFLAALAVYVSAATSTLRWIVRIPRRPAGPGRYRQYLRIPEGIDGSTLLTGVRKPQQVAELEVFRVQDQQREASVQDKLQDGLGMLSTGNYAGAIDTFVTGSASQSAQ